MTHAEIELQPWPPAFSDAFVGAARRLVEATGHVMVVGPLGSNRGVLVQALTGAHAAAMTHGRGRDGVGAPARPFAAVNELLPPLRAPEDATTSDVVARADSLLDQTFGRPTLCLLEADLCHDGSVEVLAQLVERGRIRLISTVARPAAGTHRFAAGAERIDLPPLDDATIAQLLQIRFSAHPHPTTVSMLAALSQGAYAVLKELADASFATGKIRVLAGTLVTDESVGTDDVNAAAVARGTQFTPRFSADHPAHDLLGVTAITLHLDLEEATELFGVDLIESAVTDGALRLHDDVLTFASRVEAELAERAMDDDRRRDLHERYAGRLRRSELVAGTAVRLADWAVAAGAPMASTLAVRAASQANRQGRYDLALTFVRAVPVAERPSRLVVEQCHALSETGAADELVELMRGVDPSVLDDDDLFAFLRWIDRYLPADEAAGLVELVRADESLSPERAAVLELSHLWDEVYETGAETVRKSLQALAMSGRLSTTGQALAQSARATSLRLVSRTEQSVQIAQAAVDQLGEPDLVATSLRETAGENLVLCHIANADLDGAEVALTAYSGPAIGHGNLGRLGSALWGLLAFYAGDVGSAMAQAQLCLARIPESDPHRLRGWAEAMAAQILTQVGDVDRVLDLLESSHRRPRNARLGLELQLMISQACVHDAIGEPEEALELLQTVAARAHAHQLTLAEVDAAVLCVQIGGPIHLPALLAAVEDVDESSGTSGIWQRFAWAVRDNDMHALVALAEEMDALERSLFAAEVAQFTLDVARRAADMTPEQRRRLSQIADPMQHRKVERPR